MSGSTWPALVRAFRRAALPLAAYYGVTLALPLANGAAHGGRAFAAHALVVFVVPLLLIAVACGAHALARGCRCQGAALRNS